MKKIIIATLLIFVSMGFAHAQKFAYVDTQYILDNVPEYAEAQSQLDELSAQWQKEIEAKFAEVDKMYKDYQAQAVLLPEDMKKKKEQEIVDKEKEAKALQKQRYGKDGDLMKKRQELIKPIQEKIYNAIQDIATNNNYAVIFDKAGSLTIMYGNPKYDISDDVLDNMGAAMGNRKRAQTPAAGDAGNKQQSNPPAQNQNPERNPNQQQSPQKK